MNFLCQRCNTSKATVHVTDTAPQKRERHLCEECAEKEGIIVKQQHHHSANHILQEFIKQKAGLASTDDLSCPECGITFQEFQSKGVMGCANDYEAFRSVLVPLLERAHGRGAKHLGKVPPGAGKDIEHQAGLVKLRRELQDAIDQENYERAAAVRDQLKRLESPVEP
jgi:protein arginine kinase activator